MPAGGEHGTNTSAGAAQRAGDKPGSDLLSLGKGWLGVPYLFGGDSHSGIDCSALMQEIAHAAGYNIPRTSQEQYAALIPITQEQALPGDLVFSAGSDGTDAHPGHVGMYAGNGSVLNAPHTGTVVRFESLQGWGAIGYRRIPGVNGAPVDAAIDKQAGLTYLGKGPAPSDNSLISFPSGLVDFFDTASKDLTSATSWFAAFGRVSTWLRIGAGVLGFPLLILGLVLLVKSATKQQQAVS